MEQVRETNKGGDPQNDWEGVERQRKGRGQDACLTNCRSEHFDKKQSQALYDLISHFPFAAALTSKLLSG